MCQLYSASREDRPQDQHPRVFIEVSKVPRTCFPNINHQTITIEIECLGTIHYIY